MTKMTRRQRANALRRLTYRLTPIVDPLWLAAWLEIKEIEDYLAETKALNEAEAEYEESLRSANEQAGREHVPTDEDIFCGDPQ